MLPATGIMKDPTEIYLLQSFVNSTSTVYFGGGPRGTCIAYFRYAWQFRDLLPIIWGHCMRSMRRAAVQRTTWPLTADACVAYSARVLLILIEPRHV